MKFSILIAIGVLALVGCTSSDTPAGPGEEKKENPFRGKWGYVSFVAYENDGEDTVDYTEDYKSTFLVFYDSGATLLTPSRPHSPEDSMRYYFNKDSVFITNFVDNFLTYRGRPYEFKGNRQDTLDLSDIHHVEILVRAK